MRMLHDATTLLKPLAVTPGLSLFQPLSALMTFATILLAVTGAAGMAHAAAIGYNACPNVGADLAGCQTVDIGYGSRHQWCWDCVFHNPKSGPRQQWTLRWR
jgi:hypothetical protein